MTIHVRIYLAALAILTLLLGGIAGSTPAPDRGAPASKQSAPEVRPADAPSSCPVTPTPAAQAAEALLGSTTVGSTSVLGCKAGWLCCHWGPVGCTRCVPPGTSC
jgi:hypothetical protein